MATLVTLRQGICVNNDNFISSDWHQITGMGRFQIR